MGFNSGFKGLIKFEFFDRFAKNTQESNFMKSVQWERGCSTRTDRWTDMAKLNSRSSQIFQKCLKTKSRQNNGIIQRCLPPGVALSEIYPLPILTTCFLIHSLFQVLPISKRFSYHVVVSICFPIRTIYMYVYIHHPMFLGFSTITADVQQGKERKVGLWITLECQKKITYHIPPLTESCHFHVYVLWQGIYMVRCIAQRRFAQLRQLIAVLPDARRQMHTVLLICEGHLYTLHVTL